tara:strand:+ start:275 stop:859 length:585 start_codon:yes stop_codon:yes gene_type:complete
VKIGVLALQGDFHEHLSCFKKLNVDACEVRSISDIDSINGLVIPGGESTAISKLLKFTKLDAKIKEKCSEGMPIWGTCAGLIMISKNILENDPMPLGLIDITTSRNYYGRQIDSFIENIKFDSYENLFEAVFIRAPAILNIGKDIKIIAKSDDNIPVAVRHNNILGTSFHPELTRDLRIHKYFKEMIDIINPDN